MVPDAETGIRYLVLIVLFMPGVPVCIADGVCADGMYHARKAVFCPEKDGTEREDIQMLQVPDNEGKSAFGGTASHQGG